MARGINGKKVPWGTPGKLGHLMAGLVFAGRIKWWLDRMEEDGVPPEVIRARVLALIAAANAIKNGAVYDEIIAMARTIIARRIRPNAIQDAIDRVETREAIR